MSSILNSSRWKCQAKNLTILANSAHILKAKIGATTVKLLLNRGGYGVGGNYEGKLKYSFKLR
jgi:hypothetical protein